jgi:UDPglucose 6-dehydrogenase
MAQRIIAACGGSVAGKRIAVLGLTFKPNTDDMRQSPSLEIVPALLAAGATVAAFDPVGMTAAKELLEGVAWCEDAYQTMADAEALVIITEWNQFRALDLARIRSLMKTPLMIDLRNIYEPDDLAAAGFRYVCVGRGTTPPARPPGSR